MLVDSHVALWWLDDNVLLGPQSREQISQADEVYFSAVTRCELGIKRALGKLTMPEGIAAALESGGFVPRAILIVHTARAPALPAHHRDPFDRILVAQAQLEALTLTTADQRLAAYDIDLFDARSPVRSRPITNTPGHMPTAARNGTWEIAGYVTGLAIVWCGTGPVRVGSVE